MIEFVLATANPDKALEIEAVLGDSVRLIPRPKDVPDVEETGQTLEENAVIKARALVRATGRPAIADDTGLEVEALDGRPGVWSSRYAGAGATYADNVNKLLHELHGVDDPRRARFRTVAAACWPDGYQIVADGTVEGTIAAAPRGSSGFGYDPVFVPDIGDGRTFGEMTADEKNRFSHRGRAFRSLAEHLPRVAQGDSELDTLRADLRALTRENRTLQEALVTERDAVRTLQAELVSTSRRVNQVQALEDQLRTIQGSVYWRASEPLRRIAGYVPAPARRRLKQAGGKMRRRAHRVDDQPGRRSGDGMDAEARSPGVITTVEGRPEPLPVFPSPSSTVFVNVVTESMDGTYLWAQERPAILLAAYLAERVAGRLRIITYDRLADPAEVVRMLRDNGVDSVLPVETLAVGAQSGGAIPVRRTDHFITTSWRTTLSTVAAVGFKHTTYVAHGHEVQDDMGEAIAGIRVSVGPPLGASLTDAPEVQVRTDRGEPIVLLYCGPGVDADLLAAVPQAIQGALATLTERDRCRVVGLGSVPSLALDHVECMQVEAAGWRSYAEAIRCADIGLVVATPPTSSFLVADLLAAGATVVTSSSDRIDERRHGSARLISVQAVGELEAGLKEAVRVWEARGKGSSTGQSAVAQAWRQALSPIIEKVS